MRVDKGDFFLTSEKLGLRVVSLLLLDWFRLAKTVTARLATQFSMGRQARQFRLPVDEEETSLALWRINTPLVQSGEPEPRITFSFTEEIPLVKTHALVV